MGRGLSELQRFILEKAATMEYVCYADICMEYYGWKPRHSVHRLPDGTLANAGRQLFSRKEIGEREYSRVMATISRSCKRLAFNRDLVTWVVGTYRHFSGVKITESGRIAVESFSRRIGE